MQAPTLGETVYLEGREMVVTQVRLDVTVHGSTGWIVLSDPILYQKEKMERDEKEKLVETQRIALESVTRVMGQES